MLTDDKYWKSHFQGRRGEEQVWGPAGYWLPPFSNLMVPKEGNESPPVPSGAHIQNVCPDSSSHPQNELKTAGSYSLQAWVPVQLCPLQL